MAVPVISPLAAKSAAPGKPTNLAGNDQGAADFAAVLAQQRPADAASTAASAAAPASPSATTGVQPPPLGKAGANPLTGELAAEAAAGSLEADLTGRSAVDHQNPGQMLAASGLAKGKQPEAPSDRGQANALEQIARNPGLGLGLTTSAAAAGQSTATIEPPGQRREKDNPASLVDATLVPTAAPLAASLSSPPASRVDGETGAADPLLSAGTAGKPSLSETLGQTANLAAESPASGPQSFSAALAAQPATAGAEAARTAPPSVDTPLQNPNWGRNFGEGIVWMAKNDQQSAQININPPQLGPIQITLHLNGDQASAVFTSPHAEVRQAIQDAMPQLRDQLAASGINLGQADVGSQGSTPGREFAAQQGNQNRYGDEDAILSPDTQFADKSSGQPIHRGRGLVDLFA